MKVWRRVLVAGTVYSWSALVLTLAVCGIFVRSVRSQPPAEAATSVATRPADQTYTGSKACSACHFNQYMAWKKTKHCTDAFAKMPAKYKADPSCLACHATGFGADTGFKDEASTPNLAGTTCEACHGPGSKHVEAAKPFISKKPTPEEDKMLCGTIYKVQPQNVCMRCHTSAGHKVHPAYDKE